jgi:hypothetical protein
MRLLSSSLNFLLTLVLGSMLYVFMLMQFPKLQGVSTEAARHLIEKISVLAKYKDLTELLVADDKLLLLGMIFLAHIGLSLFGEVAGPNLGGNGSRSRSAFTNWGR